MCDLSLIQQYWLCAVNPKGALYSTDFPATTCLIAAGLLDLQMAGLAKRLEDKQLKLEMTPAAKEFVVDSGYDPVYGARPLKRFIQSRVETLIARMMIAEDLTPGTKLTVDYDGSDLVVRKS